MSNLADDQLPYVMRVRSRGRTYYYFRTEVDSEGHGGKRIRLLSVPGTKEFADRYEELVIKMAPKVLLKERVPSVLANDGHYREIEAPAKVLADRLANGLSIAEASRLLTEFSDVLMEAIERGRTSQKPIYFAVLQPELRPVVGTLGEVVVAIGEGKISRAVFVNMASVWEAVNGTDCKTSSPFCSVST